MKQLIRAIRLHANMSQEQFAATIGSTPVSINRWENGKATPNQIAQKNIFDFCTKRNIDLAQLIIEQCKAPDHGQIILYHGSKKGISGPISPISRSECDFGAAFYLGTNPLQPLTLICGEDHPVFYTMKIDLTGLRVLDIGINLDWALLIAYNRKEMESAKGSKIYEKFAHFTDGYDVVKGYIANDRMYTELSNFFNGTITDVALMKCLSALDLGVQYAVLTQKACDQVSILVEKPLQQLELSALREKSKVRREEGLSLADEIVRQYRRDGRFFDEILGGDIV